MCFCFVFIFDVGCLFSNERKYGLYWFCIEKKKDINSDYCPVSKYYKIQNTFSFLLKQNQNRNV